MDRKDFLKKSMLSAAGMVAAPEMIRASRVRLKHSDYDKLMEQVGFNHLPAEAGVTVNPTTGMKSVLHKAATRGHANHGWLDTHHTFSFANYYNPERMHFGVLRVLNDDSVAAGRGFGTHPHDNMEIISIPLEGDLQHKDSMGNVAVIKQGDVQVMSAGTGVYHSEYNKNADAPVRFLQIWMFPNTRNVQPRYDQITIPDQTVRNEWIQILSPSAEDAGVWVHQNAWFHIGNLDAGASLDYALKATGNGVYAFVIEGSVHIGDQALERRDGFGVWDTDRFTVTADTDARILLMDVPMQVR